MKTAHMTVLLFAAFHITGLHAGEIRYDDVIYLGDWKQPPLNLKVLRRAPLMSSRDSPGVAGFLAPGQSVEVTGLGESQHLVVARVATGQAKGWVDVDALEAPPAGLLSKLQKAQAHRESIERHEVAVGMTRAEVRASLGKPERTARLRTKLGNEEQWFYTAYQYVPHYTQQEGRSMVSYRRVPAGQKIVTFSGDGVVEVADDQARESKPPPARVAE